MLSKAFALLFVIIQVASSERLYVDDICVLEETGEQSTCTLFKDCEEAQKQLQKNRKYPQICGYEKRESIVCCPPIPPQRPPGQISKKKCQEYSEYVVQSVRPPILLFSASEVKRSKCHHSVVKLIVGGELAESKEFPHMAALGFEPTPGDIKWACGGSIISDRFILTAAHCLNSYADGSVKYVRVGITDLNNPSRDTQHLNIRDRIAHPEYKPGLHYHDIGLIRLAKRAKMNPFVRPACLYLDKEIDAEKAIATGWGHTQFLGIGSNELLKVTLHLFDHKTCNSTYKNHERQLKNGIIDNVHFCAGGIDPEREMDTCQGDSGGPLQIYHTDSDAKCMYDIIGITSFGLACSGSPGVYTRVSNYISWIENIVWPE